MYSSSRFLWEFCNCLSPSNSCLISPPNVILFLASSPQFLNLKSSHISLRIIFPGSEETQTLSLEPDEIPSRVGYRSRNSSGLLSVKERGIGLATGHLSRYSSTELIADGTHLRKIFSGMALPPLPTSGGRLSQADAIKPLLEWDLSPACISQVVNAVATVTPLLHLKEGDDWGAPFCLLACDYLR